MVRRHLGNGGNTLSKPVATQKCSSEEAEMADMKTSNVTTNGDRPPLVSYQSSSLPSTPQLRSRAASAHPKSPTLGRNALNISPRSSPADQRQSVLTQRRHAGGCKYETGMARARRRVPYSLGPDKLGPEDGTLKTQLDPKEDDKLTGDMRELYDRLLPSRESENRRRTFIEKLQKLLKDGWPDQNISVNVFGSTGNNLGTSDSDVDVCLTTDWKELEHVCSLAELLANHGMEKVVCVSSAKVPIVKVWDPELEIACDMNVNNPIALENTELIRAYVALDPRVRPLAMIIKHWAKRRMLNDAALGGTLSSYTWICMILNFLQTRKPPILPSLQQQQHTPPKIIGGVNVAFDHSTTAYRGFGAKNTDSLGSLIFQFFRYYGHELDFEDSVMSVRLGKVITKSEKGWNLLQDNRLCVEEPFNIGRNLGNTADDTSMRGIHIELRRAFKKVSEGDLEGCCEQYIRPQEEGKPSENFLPPVPSRPVIPRAPAQTMKAPKNSGKGPRYNNGSSRGQHGGPRRPSNPSSRGGFLRNTPFAMTPHELQLQQQHQQHVLHDELFRQYQYLQMQEHELRMQLQLQALAQGRIAASHSYPHIAFPSHPASENGHDDHRSSSISGIPSTMSAPLRQQRFGYTSPHLPTALSNSGMVTNPSSPLLASALPDMRRDPRRTSVTRSSAAASNRAHSQPARSLQSPLLYMQPGHYAINPVMAAHGEYTDSRTPSIPLSMRDNPPSYMSNEQAAMQYRQSFARRPAEYMGHYIGPSPPIPAYSRSAGISPVSSQVGLAIHNGGFSPGFFPRMTSYSPAADSPPSQPISDSGEDLDFTRSRGLSSPLRLGVSSKRQVSNSLAVNESLSGQSDLEPLETECQDPDLPATLSASASEDLAFDTPSSSDDQSHDQSHDQVVTDSRGGISRGNDMDREGTPTGRFESPKSTPARDENRPSMATSTNGLGLKFHAYAGGDPLSPVHEDPTSPQVSGSAQETASTAKPVVLSPEIKRMVIPEIPSFDSLQKKKQAPDMLSNKTNGIYIPQIPQYKATTPAVPAPQQSVWHTQSKKKKPKKAADGAGRSPIVNGRTGESLPKELAERKGG